LRKNYDPGSFLDTWSLERAAGHFEAPEELRRWLVTSFPVVDRDVPSSIEGAASVLDLIDGRLQGNNIAVHCYGFDLPLT
jgi:hypothetical protein